MDISAIDSYEIPVNLFYQVMSRKQCGKTNQRSKVDSNAPLAFWGENSLTSGDTYGIFDGTVGDKTITGFLPGWHTITSICLLPINVPRLIINPQISLIFLLSFLVHGTIV